MTYRWKAPEWSTPSQEEIESMGIRTQTAYFLDSKYEVFSTGDWWINNIQRGVENSLADCRAAAEAHMRQLWESAGEKVKVCGECKGLGEGYIEHLPDEIEVIPCKDCKGTGYEKVKGDEG